MRLVEWQGRLNAEGAPLDPIALDMDTAILGVHPWMVAEARRDVRHARRKVTVMILSTPGQICIVDTPYEEVLSVWGGWSKVFTPGDNVCRVPAQPSPASNGNGAGPKLVEP